MSTTPVDRDLLQLYVLGELDDAAAARVEQLVADDPAWAQALQAEAQLELAMFEVVDAAPAAPAPAVPAQAAAPARPWWAWLRLPVMALATALAVVLVVLPRPGADADVAWHLEVQGGEAPQRGAPAAGPPTYTTGSMITLVLRPASRTDDDQRVSLWIDGRPVDVEVRREPGGAIVITGVFGETLPALTPGPHQLQVNVDERAYAHPFTWKDAR